MIEKDLIELCNKYEKIIIYGAGMVGRLVYKQMITYSLNEKEICFAVSDVTQNEKSIFEMPIYDIKKLVVCRDKALVIIATMPESHWAIEETLKKLLFKNIIRIDNELFECLAESYITCFKKINKITEDDIDVLLMASDNNASSGAFLCMVDLAQTLSKKKLRILIILPTYGDGEEILINKNLNYTYIPSKNWVYPIKSIRDKTLLNIHDENKVAMKELSEICQEHHVQLIHHNTTYTYIGAVVGKQLGIPVLWHIREDIRVQGCDFVDREKSIEFINKSDMIIVVSEFIKNCIPELQVKKTCVIYDGVDVANYYAERNVLAKNNEVTIIMVGAITPIKGQKELIEAIHFIAKNYDTKIKVLLIGKGDESYLNELHQLVDIYGLNDKIKFLGMQANVVEFYKMADIAIVCSQAEPFGRVTVEAQLSGCVVVGANTGATPELINCNQTGFLYEYGNPSDLAEKIVYVIKNREQARIVAKQGQMRALKVYTKERNAEEIEEVYKKCIMQKSL